MIESNWRPRARRLIVATVIPLGLLLATGLLATGLLATAVAKADRRYVETKQGDRPKPLVAVDDVCAWPNLTVLDGGSIVATIFNFPYPSRASRDKPDRWEFRRSKIVS